MTVWSWSGEVLNSAHDLLSLLDYGIGSGGQAFNNLRAWELTFLIVLMQRWKGESIDRKTMLLGDPWEFGNWLDTTPDGNKRQFRHMLLYLLFPDTYERISSTRQKKKIDAAFAATEGITEIRAGTAADSAGVALDKRLLTIRKALELQHPGREIDFYDPEFEIEWQTREIPATEDVDDESNSGPRVWIEKTIVRGRPDREQGPHRLGAALWSPQRDKKGRDIYSNMREVREGDVVLHLVDNKHFSGVSLSAGPADDKFHGLSNTAWEGPAYRIPLKDYIPLEPPLAREDFRVACGRC